MAIDLFVPNITFKTRIETDEAPGFKWHDLTSEEIFANRRVVLIGLPGAFTPTCSSTHLPTYDAYHEEICKHGIDDIYCMSVNDTFVMNAWFKNLDIKNVKPIPDGAGQFTRTLGFLVDKTNIGFGMRSWRYSMIIDNYRVENLWVEPGLGDNTDGDPFEVSDAETILNYLKQ